MDVAFSMLGKAVLYGDVTSCVNALARLTGGDTPLWSLLESESSVHYYLSSSTPHPAVLKLLLHELVAPSPHTAAGFDINSCHRKGRPVIGWAAKDGCPESVSALLAAGANPLLPCGDDGCHALLDAVRGGGHPGVVAVLATSRYGPDLVATCNHNARYDSTGDTAVTKLVQQCMLPAVAVLVAAGLTTLASALSEGQAADEPARKLLGVLATYSGRVLRWALGCPYSGVPSPFEVTVTASDGDGSDSDGGSDGDSEYDSDGDDGSDGSTAGGDGFVEASAGYRFGWPYVPDPSLLKKRWRVWEHLVASLPKAASPSRLSLMDILQEAWRAHGGRVPAPMDAAWPPALQRRDALARCLCMRRVCRTADGGGMVEPFGQAVAMFL